MKALWCFLSNSINNSGDDESSNEDLPSIIDILEHSPAASDSRSKQTDEDKSMVNVVT